MPTTRPDEPPLTPVEAKRVQEVVGTRLFHSRGTDSTKLTALNEIGTQQASPTHETTQHVNRILDYAATNNNATI